MTKEQACYKNLIMAVHLAYGIVDPSSNPE